MHRAVIGGPLTHGPTYYHIFGAARDPCTPTDGEYAVAAMEWRCSGCGQPRLEQGAISIELEVVPPRHAPLNVVFGVGLGIARADFLDALGGQRVSECLLVGSVVVQGRPLSDWVTFRGREAAKIRGPDEYYSRICEGCGRLVFLPGPPRYLCSDDMPTSDLSESYLHGLVLARPVFAQLDLKRWRGLRIERLPVCEQPPAAR